MAFRRYPLVSLSIFITLAIFTSPLFSQNDSQQVEIAREYYENGNNWKALGILEKVLSTSPNEKTAVTLITKILHSFMDKDIESQNSVEGEYFLAKLKKYNPSDEAFNYYKGVFQAIDGNYITAIKLLKNYLSNKNYPAANKYYYQSLINHARELLSTNSFDKALPFLEEYVSYRKDDPEAIFLIGRYYFLEKNYLKAEGYFSKLLKFSKYRNKALFYLGRCYFNIGEYQKGINLVEKSFKAFSTQKKGDVLYSFFKRYAEILLTNNKYEKLILETRRWEKDFERTLDPLFFRALANFYLARFNKAENLFLKVIKTNPTYPDIGQWLGKTYLQLGLIKKKNSKFDTALRLFEKAYFFDPHQGEAYFQAGEIYYWQKKYGNAIPLLKLALREHSEEIKSLYYLGKIYFNKKQYKITIKYLEKLYALSGNYKDTTYLLSRSYYQLANNEIQNSRFTAARVFALLSYKYDKNFLPVWYIIGASFYHQGVFSSASKWLSMVVSTQHNYKDSVELLSESYYNIGLSAFHNKKYKDAIGYFRKSLSLTPQKIKSRYYLGISLSNTGQYNQAIKELKKVYGHNKTYKKISWWLGETYYRWGYKNFKINNFKGAEILLIQSTKFDPQKKEAWYLLGLINYKEKIYSRARVYLQKAFSIDQSYRDVAVLLRNTLVILADQFNKKGKIEQAIALLRQALSIFPSDGEANYKLALLLYKKSQYVEAYEHFKAAIRAGFNTINARYLMGKIALIKGWWDNAIALFIKIKKTKPNYKDTIYLLEKAYYNGGQQWFKDGSYSRAVTYLTSAYNIISSKLNTIYMLGVSYYHLGKYNESINFLNELRQKEGKKGFKDSNKILVEDYYILAKNMFTENNYEKVINFATKGLNISPMDKRLNYLKGKSYLALRKYSLSIKFLKLVEKVDPHYLTLKKDLHDAYKDRGEVFLKKDKPNYAIRDFITALGYSPYDKDLYITLAKLFHKQKQLDTSISYLKKLLSFAPQNKEGLYLLGKYLFEKGNLVSAIKEMQKLYNISPLYKDTKKQLFKFRTVYGKKLFKNKKYAEALINFKKAVDLFPNNRDANFMLGKSYFFTNDYNDALSEWRKLNRLNFPKNRYIKFYSETLKKIIYDHWKTFSFNKLKSLLEERKTIKDDNWNKYHLGYVYFKLKKYSRAIGELKLIKGLTLHSLLIKDSPSVILGKAYLGRAMLMRSKKEWDAEIKDLLAAQKFLNNPEIEFYLGEAFYNLKNYGEAEQHLKIYTNNYGKTKEAFYLLANIEFQKGNLIIAYNLYNDFIEKGGKKEKVVSKMKKIALQIAKDYAKEKKFNEAIKWQKNALNLIYDPEDEIYLGKLYYYSGVTEEARRILERDQPYLDREAKYILHKIYFEKGRAALKTEDYPLAGTYLEKSLFYFNNDTKAIEDLIIARYNLRDFDGVINIYRKNRKLNFNKDILGYVFQAVMIKAVNLIHSNPRKALSLLLIAEGINNTSAVKYYTGLALFRIGYYSKSLNVLQNITEEGTFLIKAENLIPKVDFKLAKKLLKLKKCHKALNLLNTIKDEYKNNDEYKYSLARTYFCLGDYNKAYSITWELYHKNKDVRYYRFLIRIRENIR